MKLHIGIAAPIATEHLAGLLTENADNLPKGYGGAPFTAVLIAELLRQGHKVSAFTTDSTLYPHRKIVKASGLNFDFYICAERPRAWRLNKYRLGRALDGFAYERDILANAIAAVQPDIVHAHWTYEFALAAIKTRIPHLISCHDDPAVVLRFNPYPYRAIRYLMAMQVFRKGQHFSTVSKYMHERLQGYTKTPINIVPNPLADYVLGSGSVRKQPLGLRIGLISNGWEARKNPQPALLAFAMIHSKHPEAELHLFGHGFGSGEAAEIWCQNRQIAAGMYFHGATPHKQLIEQLNELDLLLHPALEESFGVVIAEAMALGLPVVAGRDSGAVPWVTGSNEIFDTPQCAVLTDVTSADAIAAGIAKACDQDYRKRSAAGYHRARQIFTPSNITNAYLALYQQLLMPNLSFSPPNSL